MPSRRNLPLKKVRVGEYTRQNLYYQNRSKLGLLPKFFLYLFLVGVVLAPAWYFNVLDVQAFLSNGSDIKNSPESPAKLIQQTEVEASEVELVEAANEKTKNSKSDNSILIQSEAGVKCYLNYSSQPMDIQPLISKQAEGWWLPANCDYKALRGVQIVRLNESEAHQVARKINPSNIQNLDGIDTYAIAYTHQNDSVPFAFEKYIKSLTLPVFEDRYYFSTSSAFETKRIGIFTYYLDGDCQGGGSDPCKLWRADNSTGTIELLKKNVGLTGKGEVNELRKDLVLKFATTQDYSQGVNLILLNQVTGDYKLLRVNQQEWLVFETLDIPVGDGLYSSYYL